MMMTVDVLQALDLPPLPDGYTARPPVRDDAPAIVALLVACDEDVTGSSDLTLNDFLGDWEGIDLETDAILVVGPDGSPAAYTDIDDRGNVVFFIYGYVHPTQRGRGLGS